MEVLPGPSTVPRPWQGQARLKDCGYAACTPAISIISSCPPQICAQDLQELHLEVASIDGETFPRCGQAPCRGYLCHQCAVTRADCCAGCHELACLQCKEAAGSMPQCEACDSSWCRPCAISAAKSSEHVVMDEFEPDECPFPFCESCELSMCVRAWVETCVTWRVTRQNPSAAHCGHTAVSSQGWCHGIVSGWFSGWSGLLQRSSRRLSGRFG